MNCAPERLSCRLFRRRHQIVCVNRVCRDYLVGQNLFQIGASATTALLFLCEDVPLLGNVLVAKVGKKAHILLQVRIMLGTNHPGRLVDDRGDDHEVEKVCDERDPV
jgi:hypothetical protein